MSQLNFQYGLELTFHLPRMNKFGLQKAYTFGLHDGDDDFPGWCFREPTDQLIKFCKKNRLKGGSPGFSHEGCDTLEVHSPVLKTIGELSMFYTHVLKMTRRWGFPAHSKTVISGGGHLHVSCKKQPFGSGSRLMTNVLRDCANRPYLNWIFDDPEDDSAGNTLMKVLDDYTSTGDVETGKSREKSDNYRLAQYCSKGSAINYHYSMKTLEFRIFEMPRSLEEQVLHVMFVDRYLSYLERLPKKPFYVPLRFKASSDIRTLTQKECVREFNELLVRLDLNPKDYARFVRRNLTYRFAHRGLLV